ncbi:MULTISPECIES: hypothetical protein [spotted fever group]|uniref:Uncharacterized protein n=3 Tax=spotted fever group TaxID=114277 RepID=B0BXG0_RICRO|nr:MULTISPECIES: hypothetical protein [spotted fever group]ABV76175.1 hypothetical protein A1G_03190 [Rickettsia rickettsii str. 'Sheila Smith']ABY72536.1 hypothetical protein RrIowa_0672 [Rickettsia rickettsii str. Iowa]AFB22248.1 hypothetical protein RPN_03740 [Rickettsia rickettsii str. Brazil]AFB23516.1 hypothetical protein RPL_03160 [Rickettsia rickettsii str. Colombia]AFB24868.1 hypothetical protein RPO_03180 [Rickettsia rickettsii str. Arizona]
MTTVFVLLTHYKRSSKDILEFVSPYLLKNASDMEYIKAYIPEVYINKRK